MSGERILLRGIAAEALIGVYDEERRGARPLTLDVELVCDLAAAARSDRIEDAPDYHALVRRVRERCAASSHRLIEALAAEIGDVCLEDPRVRAASVTVHKPGAVEGVADVAVVITKTRAPI